MCSNRRSELKCTGLMVNGQNYSDHRCRDVKKDGIKCIYEATTAAAGERATMIMMMTMMMCVEDTMISTHTKEVKKKNFKKRSEEEIKEQNEAKKKPYTHSPIRAMHAKGYTEFHRISRCIVGVCTRAHVVGMYLCWNITFRDEKNKNENTISMHFAKKMNKFVVCALFFS